MYSSSTDGTEFYGADMCPCHNDTAVHHGYYAREGKIIGWISQ